MLPVRQYLHALLGKRFGVGDLVVIFSARLDESGTDGISPHTVVGGAVATADNWDKLEAAWRRLLVRSKVSSYHGKEFKDGKGNFSGWSKIKINRFIKSQEKIIKAHTLFRVSVGIEDAIHSEIKSLMKDVKGFRPSSNYGLCLRYLMFIASERLVDSGYHNHRLTVLVEDGPWLRSADSTYWDVSRMIKGHKVAKHAHRLDGFGHAPKGACLSLEAADYIAGSEHGRFMSGGGTRQEAGALSLLLDRNELEKWYEGMIEEKERRRAHGQRHSMRKNPSLGGQSS